MVVRHSRIANREAPFEAKFYPQIVLEGGAVYFSCLVPLSYGQGIFRMEVPSLFASEGELWRVETKRLLERLPCGTYVGMCAIRTGRGDERREARLEVRGGNCDGDR